MTSLETKLLTILWMVLGTWVWYKMRWNRKSYHDDDKYANESIVGSWFLLQFVWPIIFVFQFIRIFVVRSWRKDAQYGKISDYDTDQLIKWHKQIKETLDDRLT